MNDCNANKVGTAKRGILGEIISLTVLWIADLVGAVVGLVIGGLLIQLNMSPGAVVQDLYLPEVTIVALSCLAGLFATHFCIRGVLLK